VGDLPALKSPGTRPPACAGALFISAYTAYGNKSAAKSPELSDDLLAPKGMAPC